MSICLKKVENEGCLFLSLVRLFRFWEERKQELRITDFFDRDNEDYNKMDRKRRRSGCSGGSFSLSPRWVLSSCLFPKRRSREPSNSKTGVVLAETGKRRTNEWERREEESKSIRGPFLLGCQTDGAKVESSSSLVHECTISENVQSSVESSGRHMKELSFNLGLGVGLVYLIAENKSELEKMMKLRTQMEMLLNEIKDGMQRKDLSYSAKDFNEVGSINDHLTIQNHRVSNHMVRTEIAKDCIHLSRCDTQRREGCPVSLDQLEAELEAELEHLQFSLCAQDSPRNLQQHPVKLVVQNDAHAQSCFKEIDDCHDSDSTEHHGICALKLERRLHELLEARQKERITELEFDLNCYKHKLLEKEMEISWWKETATLLSQRVPESRISRFNR